MLSNINNNEPTSPYQPRQEPYQPATQPGQETYPLADQSWQEAYPPAQPSAPHPVYTQGPPPLPPQNNKKRPFSSGGFRTGAILALAVALLLVFGTGLFAGWQFAQGSAAVADQQGTLQQGTNTQSTVPALTSNNIEVVREAAIAKVKPAVVQVNITTANGGALGSGVIIDKRGYIVTNNHVVDGARSIEVVLFDGTKLQAQLTGTDPADDLAVLKINPPARMTVATLGDSSKLQVGQEVLAIGNPLGITQTVTNGIVSALGRSVSEPASQTNGGATIPNTIQTDAPINPGNSGGALIDLKGNLIGIPTLAAIDPQFNSPASGVGFAIPSNRVSIVVPQIIQSGNVTHTGRAALDVHVVAVDQAVAQQDNLSVDHGVLLHDVIQGGAAQKAGLQAGDVVVQVDNKEVNDIASLSDALANKNPGDKVMVKVYRGNQQLTINVTLDELQAQSK